MIYLFRNNEQFNKWINHKGKPSLTFSDDENRTAMDIAWGLGMILYIPEDPGNPRNIIDISNGIPKAACSESIKNLQLEFDL